MKSAIAILLVVCLLSSAMISSASAAVIESTELSQSEAEDFAQAQAVSSETLAATTGGQSTGTWLIIGAVVVVAIILIAD